MQQTFYRGNSKFANLNGGSCCNFQNNQRDVVQKIWVASRVPSFETPRETSRTVACTMVCLKTPVHSDMISYSAQHCYTHGHNSSTHYFTASHTHTISWHSVSTASHTHTATHTLHSCIEIHHTGWLSYQRANNKFGKQSPIEDLMHLTVTI